MLLAAKRLEERYAAVAVAPAVEVPVWVKRRRLTWNRIAAIAILAGFFVNEIVLVTISSDLGLLMHFALFTGIAIWVAAWGYRDPNIRYMALSLLLAQGIRVSSLAIPLNYLSEILQLTTVYTLIILGCALVARFEPGILSGVSFSAGRWANGPLVLLSMGLGFLEYDVLRTMGLSGAVKLVGTYDPASLMAISVVMIGFVALGEELVFRVYLQPPSQRIFGRFGGILYSSCLYSAMHIIWNNAVFIGFAFLAGLLFGYSFDRTRNLTTVVLMNGSMGVTLYFLMPLLLG